MTVGHDLVVPATRGGARTVRESTAMSLTLSVAISGNCSLVSMSGLKCISLSPFYSGLATLYSARVRLSPHLRRLEPLCCVFRIRRPAAPCDVPNALPPVAGRGDGNLRGCGAVLQIFTVEHGVDKGFPALWAIAAVSDDWPVRDLKSFAALTAEISVWSSWLFRGIRAGRCGNRRSSGREAPFP